MDVKIIKGPAGVVAVLGAGADPVHTAQDALDLMAQLRYEHSADAIVLPKAALDEAFFDLKTGVAGEILQKFTNYQMRLAIVGDFSGYESRALKDFIYESNRGGRVFFLADEAAAVAALQKP